MRKIKYKAWDKELKKMVNVVNTIIDQDRYILSQYTGFKDKTRNEIYEGDHIICTIKKMTINLELWGKVYWSEAHAAFKVDLLFDRRFLYEIDAIQILGNIYDHPK